MTERISGSPAGQGAIIADELMPLAPEQLRQLLVELTESDPNLAQRIRERAVAILTAAQGRFTGDRDILAALVSLVAQSGDAGAATQWTQRLRALDGGP